MSEIKLITDAKITETSSKGNQEKWFDEKTGLWYKADRLGYESLSESFVSAVLETGNIEKDYPFTFTRYKMARVNIHGRDKNACVSMNFLKNGWKIETISHLFRINFGCSASEKLSKLPSDRKRIEFLALATKEITSLEYFPQYMTLLFEIDSVFMNDDRHLNNIAVLTDGSKYDYCPIFDNGGGLLSNTMDYRLDISPEVLIKSVLSRPFGISFSRQISSARSLFGNCLVIPKLSTPEISDIVKPMTEYYAQRDRKLITDRVIACMKRKNAL